MNSLQRRVRQQTRSAFVGRWHVGRRVHLAPARPPCCIIWNGNKETRKAGFEVSGFFPLINSFFKNWVLKKAQICAHLMLLSPLNDPDALCDRQSRCLFCKKMACIRLGLYLCLKVKSKSPLLWTSLTTTTTTTKSVKITVKLPWAPLLGRVPPNGILLLPQRWLPVKSLLAFMATFFFVLMPEMDRKARINIRFLNGQHLRITELGKPINWDPTL